jgi:hypothetical protein
MLLPVAVAVIAIVQLICVLALVDQYRGLLQIRESLGLVDSPQPLSLPALTAAPSPSSVGLPEQLDQEDRTIVAFLSTKCMTCRTIGRNLHGHVPANMWVVVEGPTEMACNRWLEEIGLSSQRVSVEDMNDGVASRLDLTVFPSALVFDRGSLALAQTLPSFRQLSQLLFSPVPSAAPPTQEKEHRHVS